MNKLTQTGLIDGQSVEITSNTKGTHFYSNGKRVPKDVALAAIDAALTANKPAPRKQNVASTKKNIVNINDLIDGANTYVAIKAEKKVAGKLALLKEIPANVAEFLLFWNKNAVAIGFSGKRFAKKLGKLVDRTAEFAVHSKNTDTIDLRLLNDVLLNIVEGGTRFELSTGEWEEIALTLPKALLTHEETLTVIGDVISGKVRLGIPNNKL